MLLSIPAVALYIAGQYTEGDVRAALIGVACALYALACVTDLLDGYVARTTHSVSVLGKYLDPVADKVNLCLMLFIIACFGDGLDSVFFANRVVVALLGGMIFVRETLVGMLRTVAATRGRVISADAFGKIKTDFLNVGTIVLVVAGLQTAFAWIGTILFYIGAVIAIFSGVHYFVKNKDVFADEQSPQDGASDEDGPATDGAERDMQTDLGENAESDVENAQNDLKGADPVNIDDKDDAEDGAKED